MPCCKADTDYGDRKPAAPPQSKGTELQKLTSANTHIWVIDAAESHPAPHDNSHVQPLPASLTLQNEHVRIQV
jgi:hypothetical protein